MQPPPAFTLVHRFPSVDTNGAEPVQVIGRASVDFDADFGEMPLEGFAARYILPALAVLKQAEEKAARDLDEVIHAATRKSLKKS